MGTWDPPQTPAPPGFGAVATGRQAGGGARIVAWIIDWVILVVIGIILEVIFGALHSGGVGTGLSTLISLAYFTICFGSSGQTIGYRVMHIKVLNGQGGPIGYGWGFLRALLIDLSFGLCFIPAIISLILIFATERHQAIHDLILGQQVVAE